MPLLDLLRAQDVAGFNAARGRHAAPDLFAADLAGLCLRGVDLSGANLEKADLSGADLATAVLVQANLTDADLTAVDLSGALALRARFGGAFLGDARLDGADLTRADLSGCDLSGAHGQAVVLAQARLKDAELKGVDLPDADLTGAHLGRARLAGARLPRCKAREAVLSKAVLDGVQAAGADFTSARLAGASLREAVLAGAVLRCADLTGADLTGADLAGVDLTRADLAGACLARAVLRDASLQGANLDGADLTGADLQGAVRTVEEAPAAVACAEEPGGVTRFDDVRACVSDGILGLLWENPRAEGGPSRLRVAVCALDGAWDGVAPVLPDPAEAAVARALLPAEIGFVALLFVERPGGLACRITPLSPLCDLGETRTVAFDYVPAVQPVFLPEPNGFLVAGLSRRGPTFYLHRYAGTAFELVAEQRIPTARGFVGRSQPVVLCKGGVVVPVTPAGLGRPVTAPEGFPGRDAAACHTPNGVFLAWTLPSQKGLNLCWSSEGRAPEVVRVLPDHTVGSVDALGTGGRVLMACSREGDGPLEPMGLWVSWLPGGQAFRVAAETGEDLDRVALVPGAGVPLLTALSLGEGVVAVQVGEDTGRVCCRFDATG